MSVLALAPPPPAAPRAAPPGGHPEQPRPSAPIEVDAVACGDYGRASRLEWLETNGLGGYAMGTVAGAPTRRYHGLLVAALSPPVERHLLLAGLLETAVVDGAEHPLSTAQYPGVLHPEGWRALTGFRLDPFPIWSCRAGGVTIEKRLFLVHGEDTVVVRWRASGGCRLVVSPLLAFRDHHGLSHENGHLDPEVREEGGALLLRPYAGLPGLRLRAGAPGPVRLVRGGAWYRNLEHQAELERGLDHREDLWRAATLELELPAGGEAWLVATLRDRPIDAATVEALEAAERRRRRSAYPDPLAARLSLAADQFLARRVDGRPTVLAGFPWFADWGRDTMIAIPGLLVARGLHEQARETIRAFLSHLDQGLVPNRFPDGGERPEYNTADATLWLFQAIHALEEAGGAGDLVRQSWPAIREIVAWHERGTHHGIRVDLADGLLVAGDAGTQLTWMDAKVGDWVPTPRHGKPVEVNALWHGALRLAAGWGSALGHDRDAAGYAARADRVAASFDAVFWDGARRHLVDVVRPDGTDRRLRPNQLLAVSLPHPLLDPPRRRDVVTAVEAALLTPVGLRTLAPGEPGYQARYQGGPRQRDGAYHQGVVWPWLLGPFIRARLAAFGRSDANLARCRALVEGLSAHLEREGVLGQVSEIFEAEPPYAPVGAPAQAWSVAALLEALLVDLAGTR